MKYLDDLYFWVTERERIRIKREGNEHLPWTSDPILQQYRFCNVRREDDRVTRWIHNNWLRPNDGHPGLEFAMAVARMVNFPETLADLGYPTKWDPNHFITTIAARKAAGYKCWTSAYMITGGYSAGGEPKEVIIARVLDGLFTNLKIRPIKSGDNLDTIADKIQCTGIGSFLSGQVVADVKWASNHLHANDWWYWCTPGPGSMMGLNFIYNREPSTDYTLSEFQHRVWEVQEVLRLAGVELDAQNTQNVLCELSKYIRAKHFGKRLKSSYVPANYP